MFEIVNVKFLTWDNIWLHFVFVKLVLVKCIFRPENTMVFLMFTVKFISMYIKSIFGPELLVTSCTGI